MQYFTPTFHLKSKIYIYNVFLTGGVNPPALPCLHEMYPEKFSPTVDIHYIDIQEELPKFSSDNKQSLGELFLGFLHYYTVFNYDLYAISVREGRVLMKDECRMARAPKNDTTQWKLLCIEEPFDLTNTARSVYDVDTFDRIKYIFHFAYNVLRETKDLSSIIPHAHNTSRWFGKAIRYIFYKPCVWHYISLSPYPSTHSALM